MTQKFVMYSPLYRQEQELKRQGVELTRQTMSNWQLKASKLWLDPIYERLRNLLLKEEVIHADETTLTVLKTKDKPTPNKAYMWLYRTSACSNQNIVLYEHKPNRKIENAENFLRLPGRKQAIQTPVPKILFSFDMDNIFRCEQ